MEVFTTLSNPYSIKKTHAHINELVQKKYNPPQAKVNKRTQQQVQKKKSWFSGCHYLIFDQFAFNLILKGLKFKI